MILKVGRTKIKVNKKLREFAYKDVVYHADGWADCKKYLPADFDLVSLRLADERIISGWSYGRTWEGLKLRSTDKILCWKKKRDESL